MKELKAKMYVNATPERSAC